MIQPSHVSIGGFIPAARRSSGGIANATHNTLQQKAGHRSGKSPGFSPDELRVAFSIPPGSLFLVNHPVYCPSSRICEKFPIFTRQYRTRVSRYAREPRAERSIKLVTTLESVKAPGSAAAVLHSPSGHHCRQRST
jgi:hypothetical protein